ncbi:putative had superfamily phosphatase protein [Botrytis fragariae]|uniref:Putative had superfamily phosphatase protein n=1 Tax=Botrytis fragariae TaxID=1964551 RepID=A0A8H6B115_9HELO|nr:putative had superfamily phosphatase protein [Botrytis fragariae]KAF5877145.1 putative had superfamily phosphatase protein [Botrytis fragariae]
MDMNTLNISATVNIFRLLVRPKLILPQATVSTFNHLPIPLNSAFDKHKNADIRAVVLDKDNCFAYPKSNDIYEPYNETFKKLREAYPGRRLLIVSNTAGAESLDRSGKLAVEVEKSTGVTVLSHASKKPGCGPDIMEYFSKYPETGVTRPDQIAVVGDRLTTDVMMANLMGSYSVWIKDGVVPVEETSVFARLEQKFAGFLIRRGYEAPEPASPFEK